MSRYPSLIDKLEFSEISPAMWANRGINSHWFFTEWIFPIAIGFQFLSPLLGRLTDNQRMRNSDDEQAYTVNIP